MWPWFLSVGLLLGKLAAILVALPLAAAYLVLAERKLLARLLAQEGVVVPAPIGRRPHPASAPLTSARATTPALACTMFVPASA